MEDNSTKNNSSMKKNIKIFLAIVILIGIGVGFGLSLNFANDNFGQSSGAIIEDGVIAGYTAEQIAEIMQRKADEPARSLRSARPAR